MFIYLVFLVFEASYNFSYTGSAQTKALDPGFYKFEVWGAQGGGSLNSHSGIGGKGGYSVGYLNLNEVTTVYIQVGGVGKRKENGLAEGGYNGGGCAWGTSSNYPGNGGGGGTDIRIKEDSIYSRVIVAGGGGGGGEDRETGGFGGGLTGGGNSAGNYDPGTQISSSNGGAFFQGAHTAWDGGSGGGGWYGGGTADGSQMKPTSGSEGDSNGGSGGSGYVYTESTAKNYPNGCKLTSKYYLKDASTTGGDQSILEPDGTKSTGHSGNGFARITLIDTDLNLLSSGNDYIVSGFSNRCVNVVEIKSVADGKNVVSIANNAFKDQSCIEEVKLPETIREIGSNAFENCINLVKVSFITSSSLTTIGSSAFKRCSKLNSFGDLSKVTTIGEYSFQWCLSLSSLCNLSHITSIRDYCFQWCSSLNSLGDLSKVTSVGDCCFQGCGVLNQIGDKFLDLQAIGKSAFERSQIETINLTHCTKITSFPSNAFKECFSLRSVYFPTYLTSIGSHCFYMCTSLKYVDLPFHLDSIDEYSFSHCSSLLYANIPKTVSSIKPYTFSDSGMEAVKFRRTVTISGNAFYNCSNLTSVTLSDRSVVMPDAFALCPNITKIFLSEYVTLHHSSFNSITPSVFYLGLIHVCPEESKSELSKFNLNIVNVQNNYEYDDYAGINVYRMEVSDLRCGRFPSLAYSLIESLKKFTSLSAFQVIV